MDNKFGIYVCITGSKRECFDSDVIYMIYMFQSITTKVVSSNPAQTGCTRYNIM